MLFTFYIQSVLKLKNNSGAQRLNWSQTCYISRVWKKKRKKMGPINAAALTENHAPTLTSNNGTWQIHSRTGHEDPDVE